LVHVPEQTISQELGKSASRAPRREPIRESPPTPEPVRTESKLEQYCLALALRAPERLARIAFLEGDDFTDTEYRALFVTLREFVRDSAQIDLGAFRDLLDESLRVSVDALAVEASRLVSLSDLDLIREIETTAYRMRQYRYRDELTQIEMAQRETEEAEEKKLLDERAELLRKGMAENQKALNARTMFKTRAPSLM
jgi:hypothetical protein